MCFAILIRHPKNAWIFIWYVCNEVAEMIDLSYDFGRFLKSVPVYVGPYKRLSLKDFILSSRLHVREVMFLRVFVGQIPFLKTRQQQHIAPAWRLVVGRLLPFWESQFWGTGSFSGGWWSSGFFRNIISVDCLANQLGCTLSLDIVG